MKTQVEFEYILNGLGKQSTILEYEEPIYDVQVDKEFYRFIRDNNGKIVLSTLPPDTAQSTLVDNIVQSVGSRLNQLYGNAPSLGLSR